MRVICGRRSDLVLAPQGLLFGVRIMRSSRKRRHVAVFQLRKMIKVSVFQNTTSHCRVEFGLKISRPGVYNFQLNPGCSDLISLLFDMPVLDCRSSRSPCSSAVCAQTLGVKKRERGRRPKAIARKPRLHCGLFTAETCCAMKLQAFFTSMQLT